jgi:hypothetical protein
MCGKIRGYSLSCARLSNDINAWWRTSLRLSLNKKAEAPLAAKHSGLPDVPCPVTNRGRYLYQITPIGSNARLSRKGQSNEMMRKRLLLSPNDNASKWHRISLWDISTGRHDNGDIGVPLWQLYRVMT